VPGAVEGHLTLPDTTVPEQSVSSVVTVVYSFLPTNLSFIHIVFQNQSMFNLMLPTSILGEDTSNFLGILLTTSCLHGRMLRQCLMEDPGNGPWQPLLPLSPNNSNRKGNRLSSSNSRHNNRLRTRNI